jgi:hypothetical protein
MEIPEIEAAYIDVIRGNDAFRGRSAIPRKGWLNRTATDNAAIEDGQGRKAQTMSRYSHGRKPLTVTKKDPRRLLVIR